MIETNDVDVGLNFKSYTTLDLWEHAWAMAGKALFYMQFIHPDTDWSSQKNRVERMCYHLAIEHASHYPDSPENRAWFGDWIKKFEDEVENQC